MYILLLLQEESKRKKQAHRDLSTAILAAERALTLPESTGADIVLHASGGVHLTQADTEPGTHYDSANLQLHFHFQNIKQPGAVG